jgi:hypothetical protein
MMYLEVGIDERDKLTQNFVVFYLLPPSSSHTTTLASSIIQSLMSSTASRSRDTGLKRFVKEIVARKKLKQSYKYNVSF